MNYETFLYSASRKKDYRWLIVPENFPKEHTAILSSFYNIYDKNKNSKFLKNAELDPIFLITFREFAYLFTCNQTNKSDEFGRKIYAMQGISVNENDLFEFRNEIPFVLYDVKEILNVWSPLDEREADNLSFSKSKSYLFNRKIERYKLLDKVSGLEPLKSPSFFTSEPIIISFDALGFARLVNHLSSPYVAIPSFAFGLMPNMLDIYSRFKIVAPAYAIDNTEY